MIKGKRGDSNMLTQDIIFFVLNAVFLGIMFTFLALKMNNSSNLEEIYAKEIALVLDSAKTGMAVHLDMAEGINIAQKELGKDNLGNIVSIAGNVVTVKLSNSGGYSYSFFNKINVTSSYIDASSKGWIFLIGNAEAPQAQASVLSLIGYASKNVLVNRRCNCGTSCSDYASYIDASSEESGIGIAQDPRNNIDGAALLLSLIMQESDCISGAESGTSSGIMQVSPGVWCGKYGLSSDISTCRNQISNPQINIEVGAKILKQYYLQYGNKGIYFDGCSNRSITYYGWEAALRAYNGGGCNPKYPEQDFYVENIIDRYNALEKEAGK